MIKSPQTPDGFDAGNAAEIEAKMEEIESLPIEERRECYRQFALIKLVRYLVKEKLMNDEPNSEDCELLANFESENQDGIAFMFDIRGSRWEVQLHRKEECRQTLIVEPQRMQDDELFRMDLKKSVKIQSRNADFYN